MLIDGNTEYALHNTDFPYSYKIHAFCLGSNLHYNGHHIKLQRLFRLTRIFNFDERVIGVSKMLLLRLTRAINVNAPHTKRFMLYLAILLTLKISHALSQREDEDRNCFRKIVLFIWTRQWTIPKEKRCHSWGKSKMQCSVFLARLYSISACRRKQVKAESISAPQSF